MSSQHRLPSVEVLGLYSLAADHARYIRFLQEKLASEDSTNLDDEERPLTEEERAELEAALRLNMGDAVMIEAVVSHADASFDVGAFAQRTLPYRRAIGRSPGTRGFSRPTETRCSTSDRGNNRQTTSGFGSSSSFTFGSRISLCSRATGNLRCHRFNLCPNDCGGWRPMSFPSGAFPHRSRSTIFRLAISQSRNI